MTQPTTRRLVTEDRFLVTEAEAAAAYDAVNSIASLSPNYIINGAFEINQRAFTSTTTNGAYGFDRWLNAVSGGTATYSAQTMNPGAITGASGEWTNFARMLTSGQSAAGDYAQIQQRVEDVKTLAGQIVTFSFWAKAATGTPKISVEFVQTFGTSGGSADIQINAGAVTLSTSWARYSVTTTLPSVSGKTITANSYTRAVFWVSAGTNFAARTNSIGIQNNTFDIFGVQLEVGSVATAFRRNANSIQGELAACQRYYFRIAGDPNQVYYPIGSGRCITNQAYIYIKFPQPMRVRPAFSSTAASNFTVWTTSAFVLSALAADTAGYEGATVVCTSTGLVAGTAGLLHITAASSANYIEYSAEL